MSSWLFKFWRQSSFCFRRTVGPGKKKKKKKEKERKKEKRKEKTSRTKDKENKKHWMTLTTGVRLDQSAYFSWLS